MKRLSQRPAAPLWQVSLAFGAVYVLWGSNYLAIRYAVEGVPPLLLMGLRCSLAAVGLVAWARLRGHPWPDRRQILAAFPAGALLFLGGHGLLAIAQTRVPSGVAALVFGTLPLWMVVLGGLDGVRSLRRFGTGALLGLLGVAVLVAPQLFAAGAPIDPLGVLVLLAAAASWAAGSLRSRDPRLPPSVAMKAAAQLAAGAVLLLTLAACRGEWAVGLARTIPLRSLLGLAYMVVVGSLLCFGAYVWLLGVRSAAQVGTYTLVNPLVAVLLGWLVAAEPMTPRVVWACALVVVGVALVHGSWTHSGATSRESIGEQRLRAASPLPFDSQRHPSASMKRRGQGS